MKYLILVLMLTLVGCDAPPEHDWQRAQLDYRCSTEQMAKAQSESTYCSDNTTYYGSYCFGSAIIRNCTLRSK